jgi:hypothetical protein
MEKKNLIDVAKRSTPQPKRRPGHSEKLGLHPFHKVLTDSLKASIMDPRSTDVLVAGMATLMRNPFGGEDPLNIQNRGKAKIGFSEEQAYGWDVFDHARKAECAVEGLEEAQIHVSWFPQPREYGKLGITEHKWIHYHFAHYIVIEAGILDTILVLTNSVFRLGLHPRDCTKRTVAENEHVRQTPVRDAVLELDKTIAPHRQPRNLYAHRGEIPKLEALELLGMYSFAQHTGEPIVDEGILDAGYRVERTKISGALETRTGGIVKGIEKVFTSLKPIYEARLKSFREE